MAHFLVGGICRVADGLAGWKAEDAAAALRHNEYSLMNFNGSRFSVDEVKSLAEALKNNTSCKEMIFCWAGLTDDHVRPIAEMLKHNKALTDLDLAGNQITDVGAEDLAQALLLNESLRSVSLQGNLITDKGSQRLAAAAARHKTLETLDLGNLFADVVTLGRYRSMSGSARATVAEAIRKPMLLLANSNFGTEYHRAFVMKDAEQVYKCVEAAMLSFIKDVHPLLSLSGALDPLAVPALMDELRQEVEGVEQAKAARLSAPEVAAVIWTSAKQLCALMEFYTAHNWVLRLDVPGDTMKQVASFNKTLNACLVNRDLPALRALPWPDDFTFYRGTWIPYVEVEWLRRKKHYRVRQPLATSDDKAVAERFIKWYPKSTSTVEKFTPVLFRVHVDKNKLCVHVTLLKDISTIATEREWLFAAYSSFEVVQVHDSSGPFSDDSPLIIDINAEPDNQKAGLELPVAEYC